MIPTCVAGISIADQMLPNSSEMLWREKKAERSFESKTVAGIQTVSCQAVEGGGALLREN